MIGHDSDADEITECISALYSEIHKVRQQRDEARAEIKQLEESTELIMATIAKAISGEDLSDYESGIVLAARVAEMRAERDKAITEQKKNFNESIEAVHDIGAKKEVLAAAYDALKAEIGDLESGIASQDKILTNKYNDQLARSEKAEAELAAIRAALQIRNCEPPNGEKILAFYRGEERIGKYCETDGLVSFGRSHVHWKQLDGWILLSGLLSNLQLAEGDE
jgi:chromosome segregation ATPase